MVKSIDVRESGFLDGILTRMRAKKVDELIPSIHRSGMILDIGCGTYPYFLLNTDFSEKHGLEKRTISDTTQFKKQKIYIKEYDLEQHVTIPYDNNSFDVLTMLAVFEHFDTGKLIQILNEVYRVLKPGGVYALTVPAGWTDKMLSILARFKLVSASLFNEHKDIYTHKKVASLLHLAGFQKEKMRFGYFEIYMNLWVMATK